jgi:predicted acyltransferase
MTKPLDIYLQQIAKHSAEQKKLERRSSLFGWLRLLAMCSFFASIGLAWLNGLLIFIPLGVLFITFFFIILTRHLNTNVAIENLKRLIQISEIEIDVLGHYFTYLA